MEVRRKMAAVRHEIDDLIAQQVRFATRYADTIIRNWCMVYGVRCKVVQRTQEVDEGLAGRATEIADIHTGEDDLFRAAFDGFLRLLDERRDRRIAALAARQRDGAIRAEIVTAVLHLQKAPRAVVFAVSKMEVIDFTDGRNRDIGDWRLEIGDLGFQPLYELVEVEFLFLAEDIVHTFDMRDLARLQLRVAARDDEDGIGVLAPDTMNHLAVLMVRRVRHGAGVDDADIRLLAALGARMTTRNECLSQGTALREIEFAT